MVIIIIIIIIAQCILIEGAFLDTQGCHIMLHYVK